MVRTVVLALLALAALPCTAQYPAKPIRIVIPFVAGGSSDIVGRAIGSKFQEFLHQPAVVENRPGANGAIAAEFVAKSDADGYTILVGSIGVFSINAALFRDLRYQPLRDFAPITLAVTTPNVLIAKPALPPESVKELVELAKLNDATVRGLRSPEIRERMTQIGFDVVAGTPEEFGAFMKAEIERWAAVVERGGIKPD